MDRAPGGGPDAGAQRAPDAAGPVDAREPLRTGDHALDASRTRPDDVARHQDERRREPAVEQADREHREIGGYRLVRRIGSGGMGEVHEAIDGDGHRVALKLLHPHVAREAASRARLAREVALLHRVKDPGVARVIDAEVEDLEAFVVTELVDGPTLEADVAQHGAFSGEEIVMLAHGLADALRAIHGADIVHRDLKPGNVMLSRHGPVLIDFGIAQVVDDERLTQTGLVTGTPGYLDPEVLAGAEPAPACDWWAWAAVLVHASTARPPFGKGPTAAVLGRVATGRVDLDGVEPLLSRALGAALSPDPAHRLDPETVLRVVDGEIDPRELDQRIAELQARRPGSAAHDVLPADATTGVLPAGTAHLGHEDGRAHGRGAGYGYGYGYGQGHAHGPGGDGRTRVAAPGWGAGGPTATTGAAEQPRAYPPSGAGPAGGGAPPPTGPPDGAGELGRDRGRGRGRDHVREIGPLSLDRPGSAGPDPYRPGSAQPGPSAYGRSPDGVAAYGPGEPLPAGSWGEGHLGDDGRPPAWARPHARRTGVAAAAGLALASVAPHAPGWFLVVLVLSAVLLAGWGQAVGSRRQARLRRGLRPGDTGRMVAALPWHGFVGLLTSSVGILIGLVLAASVVLGAELLTGEPASTPVLLLAGLLAVAGVWLAPTASNAREGLRSVVATLAPGRLHRVVLVAALLAVAVVAGGLALAGGGGDPRWWPLPDLSAWGPAAG